MFFLKIVFHIHSFLKLLFYKILFSKRLDCSFNLSFRKGFSIVIDNNGHVSIGSDVFFNNYCSIASMSFVSIGDGTIFGENVKIYDHNHCYKDRLIPIKLQGYNTAPISIGKHCWIGSNVVILKGVTIGDNCVIGAGCVVYKDIPSDSTIINKQAQEIVIN